MRQKGKGRRMVVGVRGIWWEEQQQKRVVVLVVASGALVDRDRVV
jgi:hypothetical protein